ncbi:MAG: hypothetical protein GTO02_21160, partial [Candidatus Dadabacteria bacterium]|nr:hypothetical protein [Candidatus Dadabacteria bacterium]
EMMRPSSDPNKETYYGDRLFNELKKAKKNRRRRPAKSSEFTIENNPNNNELDKALNLIKRIDENDKIRAYKNKLGDKDTKLKRALDEIEKLRTEAILGMKKEGLDETISSETTENNTTKVTVENNGVKVTANQDDIDILENIHPTVDVVEEMG